jgi:hypothetical protein
MGYPVPERGPEPGLLTRALPIQDRKDQEMIRNLKVLGLALGVVFALGAVMASGASATDTLTVPQNADITAEATNEQILNITSGATVKCQKATFSSSNIANGASKATVSVKYFGNVKEPTGATCDSVFGQVTVDMNGCTYDITGNTTKEDEGKKDAVVWVSCPGTEKIKITAPGGCTISIGSQTPTEGGVVYTTETETSGKKDIKIHSTVTGITYDASFACLFVGIPSHGQDADYTGTVTAKAYKAGSAHNAADQIDLTDSET